MPYCELDVMFRIPLTELTASSMGLEMRLSISAGPVPGYVVVMVTYGMSTRGRSSTCILERQNSPRMTRVVINTMTNTGRWMESLVSHIRVARGTRERTRKREGG